MSSPLGTQLCESPTDQRDICKPLKYISCPLCERHIEYGDVWIPLAEIVYGEIPALLPIAHLEVGLGFV